MLKRRWLTIGVVVLLTVVGITASGCGIDQKRQRAGLLITTVDATAAAYLNDTYLNKTPLIEKDLKPGTFTVRLVADDTSLVPFEDQVTLTAGTLTTLTWKPATSAELASSVLYQLEPLEETGPFWKKWLPSDSEEATGELKVISVPDSAIIRLDEQDDRQFAPFVFSPLPAGQINLSVFLPSYETHQHTLDIQPGYRTTAVFKLAKNPPDTVVESEPASPSATSPTASISATASERSVVIQKTGYFENNVEVLRVRASPDASAITIGMAPVGVRLPYRDAQQTGWYGVRFGDTPGWVSQTYAVLEDESGSTATPSASE